jgi:hypothetical protein
VNLADALTRSGASYRRLDYWTRVGYLHVAPAPIFVAPDGWKHPRGGSGYERDWPELEIEVARRMVRYLRAGLTLAVAATAARRRVEQPGSIQLDADLWLQDTEPSPAPPCTHESLSGDEGPIEALGRWPTRWRCDGCGAIVNDADREPSL